MWKIRELQDKVTNMVMNYSEVESKVREATNDDTWGPHGSIMTEIAKYTFTYEHFPEVMSMLWKRMLQEKKNWRRVYKSLLLLSYLLRNGSERVVTSSRDHIYDMRQLEDYQHIDEHGRDQGINIRHKVKELIEIIQDDQRLRDERKKAKKSRDKYKGVSCDEVSRKYDYSDRYNAEPKNFDDAFNEFDDKTTKKSSFRKFRERTYSGNKDGDYKDDVSNKSDEEEGEDAFGKKERIPQKEESPVLKKAVRKVDLGAAATYAQVQRDQTRNSSGETTLREQAQPTQSSAGNELVDLFSSSESRPVASIPPFHSDPNRNSDGGVFGSFEGANHNNANDFADFSAFSEAKPASPNKDDFADFQSSAKAPQSAQNGDADLFQDFASASSSNQDLLSKPSMGANVSMPFQTQQAVNLQGMPTSMQPTIQPAMQTQNAGSNMLKTTSPMSGMMSNVPMMAGNQGGVPMMAGNQGGTPMMAGNQGGAPMMAGNQGGVPMMAGNQGGTPMMGGLSTMGGGNPSMGGQPMMMTGAPMMGGAGMMGGGQNMMGGGTMTPSPVMGNMMSSQQGMMSPQSSANVSKSSMTSNPTKNTQQVSSASSKLTTWSNSGVDISLDNLAPVSQKEKPHQPSMNQLYMQHTVPPQMSSPGMGYYGNTGGMQQTAMYGGNQMGMPMNMMGNGVGQMNMVSPPGMMNRNMMAQGGAVGMQQPGMVGANQNFGRVMQFK
ncbi:clathrin interactor 1-like isoform X2 [Dendronephthya gigantea]|uniref:clathrin interactor 1-like isoform X2 n=1 Tax=Dendronephthya gigantea TaxID=151771 RepID=UPI00106DCB8D|nr:clathrin interactor 1-like isoform X2 [Dendronephthya gigantea]